ncbi:SGNH/GDSL hydrolase family protein [Leptolyngbya ohadii]|uniref:SGNH/GDSL hydrolase family protein n=1 Tax=Leptolyngbya ohadii TaxID=1962290 RepID=UPI000B59DB04|nr:SGNH/GDSL hydrolase family protein [Leptolyngbya ohadii]
MRILLFILLLFILPGAIVGLVELGLRSIFGFGQPLLYVTDPKIGYLLAPSQTTRRFGNRITINQYSMRNASITPQRSPDTLRILLLGDSIANGGWWTDQNQTISALLQDDLQTKLPTDQPIASAPGKFQQVEVLNASANSWSPRNQLAYLQRFGSFESQAIVLLINTDDLFGIAPTSVQVGRDSNYPSTKPPFALAEVIQRYLFKSKPIPELVQFQQAGGDRVGENLAAIGQIQAITVQSNAQFFLVITPLLRELKPPGARDYEKVARDRLQAFTKTEGILFLDVLPLFADHPEPEKLYRDHIHLSAIGNRELVKLIRTTPLRPPILGGTE